jgi:hypothetical protein
MSEGQRQGGSEGARHGERMSEREREEREEGERQSVTNERSESRPAPKVPDVR